MTATALLLPARRADLVIKPIGNDGRHVVKDPQSAKFFQIGPEEHFLLEQLDGQRDAEAICAAFKEQFGESLTEDDLDGFLEMAGKQGLLEIADCELRIADSKTRDSSSNPKSAIRNPKSKQSILYWRKRLFDPDRFCNWLEPKIRCFWTRGFLIVSALCIAIAVGMLWFNRSDVVTSFTAALRWETVVIAWLVMMAVVTLHEFAHGLTCKHYGGEVREIRFLLMFFMPCFYCNVSDAWLFREKSKRLWVTFAGGYFELFLWALAVFVWRLTALDSLVNYLAFLVIASAGVQSLFNFNPLLKLDGYYLLSDAMEIPNLRQRALQRVKAHFRRLAWGGPKPDPAPRGRFLTGFGLICWGFSTLFLVGMLYSLSAWFRTFLGMAGYGLAAALAVPALLGVFHGTTAGEFTKMITRRFVRTALWLALLGGIVAGLCYVEVDEYSSGDFTICAAQREEVRGPVAGFLKQVYVDEGDRVSPGDVIARLEIPDLDSRIAQKQAELKEAAAQLALLKAGARPEQIADQKLRIKRAEQWQAAAQSDLTRMRQTLGAELKALAEGVAGAEASRDAAKTDLARTKEAFARGAATQADLDKAEEGLKLAAAKVAQAGAEREARRARGTLTAEQELTKRAKDLAAERAALTLLQAGARPQELAAAQAKLDRLTAELRHLRHQQSKLEIRSRIAGIVVTPRLREKAGQYIREGDAICVVEDRSHFEAEITLTEDKLEHVASGLNVALKARALPYQNLTGRITALATTAESKSRDPQNTLTLRCRLHETPAALRTTMTGHARIYTGRKPIGKILLDRAVRLLRTEWWW
jgi:putative peptide zinc metalloprotease protein